MDGEGWGEDGWGGLKRLRKGEPSFLLGRLEDWR